MIWRNSFFSWLDWRHQFEMQDVDGKCIDNGWIIVVEFVWKINNHIHKYQIGIEFSNKACFVQGGILWRRCENPNALMKRVQWSFHSNKLVEDFVRVLRCFHIWWSTKCGWYIEKRKWKENQTLEVIIRPKK